jgi:predicted amidohydrolase YtcJ
MMTLYYNGTIHTQSTHQPQADTMLVENGKIISVGKYNELVKYRKSETTLVDLKGKHVLPAFNDAHIHVWKVGQLDSFIIDLRGVESITKLQQKVKEVTDRLPKGTWIVGRGFNEAVLAERRMPVKEDLDAVSIDHPIYLIRTCAHIAATNSFALEKANVTNNSQAPEGGVIGKDDSGNLTGIFYETAIGLVANHIPPPTKEEYIRMIKLGAQKLLSVGVTSATDPAVHPELLEAYYELYKHGELPIRMNLMPILLPDGGSKPYPVPEKFESEWLSVNTVKFFSDGGLSGKTAALKKYYRNSTDKGVLRLQRDHFLALATEAQQKGFRIGTHAIGDDALDLVIDVYKTLYQKFGNTRNRIEHFGLPSDENINDVAQYGFVPVPQTIFLDELGENFISSLDDEYLKRCYPVKTLLNKQITVAFSTDAPVVKNINPWSGIKAAATRKTSKGNEISLTEAITVKEAVHAYTVGSAFAEMKENVKGTLEPGKVADFIIIDRNPFTVSVDELESINVLATYINGNQVYKQD